MRVVAGTHGGRILRSPEGSETRPTSDRVRESVFNALWSAGAIEDADVADLFAGSGALGIEALSRGARHAWFVESDAAASALIDENLATLDLSDRATNLRGSVDARLADLPDGLDLVLVDPPYAFDGWASLLVALAGKVADDALVVLESDRSVVMPAGWTNVRERSYGGTVVTFAGLGDGSDPQE